MSMAIFLSLMADTLFVRVNLLPDFIKRDRVAQKTKSICAVCPAD